MSECVLIYARKSKEQEKGDTIQQQFEICKNLALLDVGEDTEFIEFYDEQTGKDMNRAGIMQVRHMLDTKRINYLYVYRIDRLGRNAQEAIALKNECQERGVTIVSATEGVRTDNGSADLLFNLLATVAEGERAAIIQRVSTAFEGLSTKGAWLGGTPPFGYKSVRIDNNNQLDIGGKKFNKLEINETEANIVTEIYRKYTTGELKSFHKLAQMLEEEGIRTRKGKEFSDRTLNDMLSNPVYVKANQDVITWLIKHGYTKENLYNEERVNGIHGIMRTNTNTCSDDKKTKLVREDATMIANPRYRDYKECKKHKAIRIAKSHQLLVVGIHEGIIDAETWLEAQKRMEFRQGKKSRICEEHNNVLLTNGIFKCKKCGSTISYFNRASKTDKSICYPVYKCSGKRSHQRKCSVGNINATELDECVINEIFKIKEEITNNLDYLEKAFSSIKTSNEKNEVAILEANMNRIKRELENFKNNMFKAALSDAFLKELNSAYDEKAEQLRKIEERIQTAKSRHEKVDECKNTIALIAKDLIKMERKTFDKLSMGEKRKIVMDVISYVEWDGCEVHIHFKAEKEIKKQLSDISDGCDDSSDLLFIKKDNGVTSIVPVRQPF